MKLTKKLQIFFFTLLVFGMITSNVQAVSTTEWISTTYDRINIDRVDITTIANFTLENNYTALKLYYAVWPTETDSGSAIATKTVDYANYNNATSGTVGEVKQTTVITAYDSNAQDVNIFGADKVYLRLYIYNASVSSANLIVKSAFDLDYWPVGGRYTTPTTSTTSSTSGTNWDKYALYLFAGFGVFIMGLVAYNYLSKHVILFRGPQRDTLEYKNGRKAWAKRDSMGRFTDIQDPGRAMAMDRAQPHKYDGEHWTKEGKFVPGADRRSK